MAMIIFFSIVLTVYFFVNLYIFKHSRIIFSSGELISTIAKYVLLLTIFSYPIGRVLERIMPSLLSDFLVKAGSVWLGAMLYLTLLFLVLDIVRLGFWITSNYSLIQQTAGFFSIQRITIVIYIFTAVTLTAGYFNALYPRVNRISIKIDKQVTDLKSIRIGAASDIHLGTVISNGRLQRFVDMMNEQKPDIILLAGDIFDEDLSPVIKRDMGKLLTKLDAPMGVYAVTGNHEFIGGVVPAVNYLEEHGINVIRDSVVVLNDKINIVGREDRQSKYMGNYTRKSIDSLLKTIDLSIPTILLDHQPYNLHEAMENGIDLQISGHTHHGQMWPFNYITSAIFEVSQGYLLKGNTHFYVSTGFGTWGPPIRIGNRPEIVVFDVKLAN